MRRLLLLAVFLLLLGGALFGVIHWQDGNNLRARLITVNADIGIPGITKMYRVSLSNSGRLPIPVVRCDYVSDAMSEGAQLAYAIELWDPKNANWTRALVDTESSFCKPYPLGIVRASLRSGWLWPGEELQTEAEATGARFHKGDKVRFVVFWGRPGDFAKGVATAPFDIDEQMQDAETAYRVSH